MSNLLYTMFVTGLLSFNLEIKCADLFINKTFDDVLKRTKNERSIDL